VINSNPSVCLYGNGKCPISLILCVNCSWTGTVSDLLVHIPAEHDSEFREVPGLSKVNLLALVRERGYFQLVLLMGEFFWLVWATEHNTALRS
jgi:hypothetical protein